MPFLSWDLHLHPGPSNVPRWGSGSQIWEAARDAGVAGFVWKSHEFHTADRAAALPAGPPHAFGSASLNPWAGVEDVMAAVEVGARWVWGPTQNEALENATHSKNAKALDALQQSIARDKQTLENKLAQRIDGEKDYAGAAGLVREMQFMEKLEAEIDGAYELIE